MGNLSDESLHTLTVQYSPPTRSIVNSVKWKQSSLSSQCSSILQECFMAEPWPAGAALSLLLAKWVFTQHRRCALVHI
jgi:hypothetical protein